ncbi:family 78 glycoside hydrolase catalytic domain [Pedobacter immunditicola]|uniref:family 78 glycoside hydrolase catalytic domain n=1 Tax=Pedobacter immunditicola TaxID=3133440 RepID=UPI00309EEE30
MNKTILFFWIFFFTTSVSAQQLKVISTYCDYLVNPSGVETLSPSLSWKFESLQRNVKQSAYQILVADNLTDISNHKGNVWDSNKILSDQSIQNKYNGKTLISSKTYYWKVKVWDNKGTEAWSKVNSWQMGLLSPKDWHGAKWIAYEKLADSNVNILPADGKKDKFTGNNILPLLRKSFKVDKTVKKATMFISGLGHFEMNLNGEKVGDHFLDPGWTKYDKEALYVAFDLTQQLKKGENVVGVMLGNGFYYIPPVKGRFRKLKGAFGYPKMICRLLVEYEDGSFSNVTSDESWKTSPSAITFSSIYGGEDYNANLEQTGWDSPGYNDKTWKQALVVDGPSLNSQKAAPVKVFENFKPITVNQNAATGDWIYDLGQNASGIIELKVSGRKGDTVRVIPGELLKADGTVNQKPTGSPYYFQYILKGSGIETWRPRFTYSGFRYIQLKGGVPPGKNNTHKLPIVNELTGLHIRNAATKTGSFKSSNKIFNQTNSLIDWAIKSNMVSVFTDCPHREKLGWLEQLHLMGSSIRYNYEAAPLFKKALQDMKNSQTAEGLVPEIAPEYVKFEWGGDMFRDSPEWGSSSILLPWYLYQWYGDKQSLADNFPMMQRYVAYLGTKSQGFILSQGLGDWYDLGPKPPGVSQLTPMGITATAIYYHDLKIMEKIALLLSKDTDAAAYNKLAVSVREAFNRRFFNNDTKQYGSGSQTANAMAVYMELVEPGNKNAVVQNIIKDIESRNNSLTAGDIGHRYLLQVLENEGRSDVIFNMNSRSDVPGYGYQIEKGATALTESWAALPTVSNNHFMLGHLMEWFYTGVGGIRQEKGSVAFSHIRIYPEIVGDLQSATTSYDSPHGRIATEWKKTASTFELILSVPANTVATVYIPAGQKHTITENNNLIKENQAIKILGYEKDRVKIKIGSGNYHFKIQ